MFSAKDINLKSFDTENLKQMGMMLYNCLSISSLNMSNFNIINVRIWVVYLENVPIWQKLI